jgi:hypothetical protein
VRYVLPYVVLLLPYAVYEAAERFGPLLRRRKQAALALLAIVLAGRLALALPGARGNPRDSYAVEPRWHETSTWLSRALVPGERFAINYQSYYSTWDLPRPDPDPRWNFWLGMPAPELRAFMDRSHIRKVLIDTADAGYAEHAAKLSQAADAHGPLTFLDWPRCFTDSATPSRFLIYCAPVPASASPRE